MDTVSEATAGMPDHEAEILSSNALQATGHMGAMPPSSFSSNLMGDFLDPIQITVPPVTSSLIPDRDAPQKPQDTPAEIGEKRPAIDDGLPPKVQELDDDPDEPKAPEPGLPEKPAIDLEFADPTPHIPRPTDARVRREKYRVSGAQASPSPGHRPGKAWASPKAH